MGNEINLIDIIELGFTGLLALGMVLLNLEAKKDNKRFESYLKWRDEEVGIIFEVITRTEKLLGLWAMRIIELKYGVLEIDKEFDNEREKVVGEGRPLIVTALSNLEVFFGNKGLEVSDDMTLGAKEINKLEQLYKNFFDIESISEEEFGKRKNEIMDTLDKGERWWIEAKMKLNKLMQK